MEGLQKAYHSAISQVQDSASKITSLASALEKTKPADSTSAASSSSSGIGQSSAYSVDQSRLMLTRPPRRFVSIWTCSKLCAFCFLAGVFAGYTLKRRVRRWASRLLRRLKDD